MFDSPIRPIRAIRAIRGLTALGLRSRPTGQQLAVARRFSKKCAAKSKAAATAEPEQPQPRSGRGLFV
jgi:hypothetical protein